MSVTGTGDGAPIRAGVSIIDMGAGTWMALGILAALFERQRSGRGQRVDASLFQTGVMLMAYHLVYQQFTDTIPLPQGSRHTFVCSLWHFCDRGRDHHDRHFKRSPVPAFVRGAREKGVGSRTRAFVPTPTECRIGMSWTR